MDIIQNIDSTEHFIGWETSNPFPYCVIDDFLNEELAHALSNEFAPYNDPLWHSYENPLEDKKTTNSWNHFQPNTYRTLSFLNSPTFLNRLCQLTKINVLLADPGLNGGGLHIHKRSGRLNPHLDYSMHPRLPYQRKLNLLIYLNPNWKESWGGHLGLFTKGTQSHHGECVKKYHLNLIVLCCLIPLCKVGMALLVLSIAQILSTAKA